MNNTPDVRPSCRLIKQTILSGLAALAIACCVTDATADETLWVHPLCQSIPVDRNGPFVAMPDGGLMTVDAKGLRTSKDDGKTWSEPTPVCQGISPSEPASFYLLRTKSGALVLVYLDMANYKFAWDDKAGEPKGG
jgi:sialidase-1